MVKILICLCHEERNRTPCQVLSVEGWLTKPMLPGANEVDEDVF